MLAHTRSASAAAPADDVPSSVAGDPLLALAVDTLKQGLILFDATGHVIGANAAARRSIDQREEIELAASAEPPHDRIRLRMPQPRELRAVQALVLTFEHGQPGLILQLSPIVPQTLPNAPLPQASVLGVLIDRCTSPALEPMMLRDLFGLTDAESRVAEAYLRVDTVKEVAALLGVSANTIKTHLAAVYLKTGCTRQAQLVRLLMALSEVSDEAGTASPSR
jgi:DNA-binding CsgD family transcriptional regulator